jgi:hypothetical protein
VREVGAARGREFLSRPRFLLRARNESVAMTREKIEQRMDDFHAALAVLTNSNFVGCSTGRSAGFAPFNILSTYVAARWDKSVKFVP